jgi:hypothetical protein
VSGPAKGESFHLPEPELLLMYHPSPPHTSKAVSLLHLDFHTHLPFLLSFTSPEPQVVVPTCLWQQQVKVALLTTSGPRPSGRKEQAARCPRTDLWTQLLSALHEVHSLCLPWAQALVITGFKSYPLRKSGRAAHFLALPGPLLWSPGFPSPKVRLARPLCWEQLGLSEMRLYLPGAFHAPCAASPCLFPPGCPSVALCPATQGLA